MAQRILRQFTLFLLFLFLWTRVSGQETLTEQDLILQAGTWFETEQWKDALPLYAQLVSVYPDNAEYNYRFGVCSLLGSRSDSERPIRYLNVAYRTMPDSKDLLFYLGLAYYQDLEFSSALRFFHRCLDLSGSDAAEQQEIKNYIQSCERGMELLHRNQLDEIISRAEFQYANFHRAYPADELEGSLIQKPDNFMTPKEQKSGNHSFVYVSEPRGVLYFSGYADDAQQRDIFRVTLNKQGEWGKPERLSDLINSPRDEDYPIVTDDGSTLYFSSRGHNSMGGYDVFRSVYDIQAGEFGAPQNMGIGINSPFDDFLYIPDISGRGAFFASDRESQDDNVTVYRVTLNEDMVEPGEMMAEGGSTWQATGGSVNGSGSRGDSGSGIANDIRSGSEQLAVDSELVMVEERGDGEGEWSQQEMKMENTTVAVQGDHEGMDRLELMDSDSFAVVEAEAVSSSGESGAQLVAAALEEIDRSEQESQGISLGKNEEPEAISISTDAQKMVAHEEKTETRESSALNMTWELVYEDESSMQPSETEQIAKKGITEPARPVSTVVYRSSQNMDIVPDEELEITLETDPVRQVQAVRYAQAQAGILEEDEVLEIRQEQEIPMHVERVAHSNPVTAEAMDEELEISRDPEQITPVQLVRYAAAQEALPEPDEELELRIDASPDTQVERVEYVFNGGPVDMDDAELEASSKTEPRAMAESVATINTSKEPSPREHLTSLTASNGGLVVFPEPVVVPMASENGSDYADLIQRALNAPDGLTYEELLFAASMVEDPVKKLRIYNVTFIRSERDWRAYYNASIAARDSARPELAEVYMYQAGLIYDDELVGQVVER